MVAQAIEISLIHITGDITSIKTGRIKLLDVRVAALNRRNQVI